jgi:hypothetical protein
MARVAFITIKKDPQGNITHITIDEKKHKHGD